MAGAMSKGFFEFVKSIGESKSYQEESRIVENEMTTLKERMSAKSVDDRQMREYIIRMVYCEMLGHASSFGHIHAVKFTRKAKLSQKRVGYLACTLCLHKEHELMLLLVGGLQTDLQSANMLEVGTALTVLCKLVNNDTIPAVLPLVLKLVDHKEANIRKKAVMVLHRFHQLDPNSVMDLMEKGKRLLCDKDPSVMGASLNLMHELVDHNLARMKELVPSFVSILKQIIEHRLPKDYDYHRMPAPWMQINLLQILGKLGHADLNASEGMYEVLHETLRRADIGINVGYAIIYECVKTITSIYPNPQLLAEAAKCTSRFITSDNHNLKYMGVNALASIVQVNPKYVSEHQMVVIDCLEDPDETLRRKTLDLLFKMTSPENVEVVIEKLLASLKDSVDVFLRRRLVEKITKLAESYSPDSRWYVETMNDCFTMAGDIVGREGANSVIITIGEAIEDDEDDFKKFVVDAYLDLLEKPRISPMFFPVILWVLGEYSHEFYDASEIIGRIWEVLGKRKTEEGTLCWGLASTLKLMSFANIGLEEEVLSNIEKLQRSPFSDIAQRAAEVVHLNKNRALLPCAQMTTMRCAEVEVDDTLSFLDAFVNNAIANGAAEYNLPDEILLGEEIAIEDKMLKFNAYEKPPDVYASAVQTTAAPTQQIKREDPMNTNKLKLGNRARVWGPTAAAAPAPVKEPSPSPDPTPAAKATVAGPWNSSQSSSAATNSTPTPAKKEEPAELTEKQKMANMLFGGSGRTKRAQKRGRKARPAKKGTKTAAPKRSPQVVAAQPVAQKKDEPVDLLDLSSLGSSGPKQPTAAPVASSGAGDLLGDLFGGPAPTQKAAPAPATGGLDDLLSFAATASSPTPAASSFMTGIQIPQDFQNLLNSAPKAYPSEQTLYDTQSLRVCFNISLQQPKSSACIFIVNKSSSSMTNIKVQAQAPMSLSCGWDRKGVPPPQLINVSTFSLNEIPAGSTAAFLLHLGAGDLARLSNAQIPVGMQFTNAGASQTISVQLPVRILDLVRPVNLNVGQFEANWKNTNAQLGAQAQFASPISSPVQYSQKIQSLQIFPIKTMGNQVVSAGQIRSANSAAVCPLLIFGQVNQGQLGIQIRTPSKQISDSLMSDLRKALS